MSTLLWIIIGIALFHWIYEGIILPSLRFSFRCELFELRDALRDLKQKYRNEISDEVFRYLQGSINNGLVLLPITDLRIIYAARAIERDESLISRLEKREAAISNCKVKEIQEIKNKLGIISIKAFVANTAGSFVYIVPVLYLWHFSHRIFGSIKKLVLIPEQEIEKAMPSFCPA
jgi:hypothetical protein